MKNITKKYKYILFDWDGCLAKTLDVWLSAYATVFKSEGIQVTEEDIIRKAFSQREKGMEIIGSKDPVSSWAKVVDIVNQNVRNVNLYLNAERVLKEIKIASKKIGLLTSSDKQTVMPAILNNNLHKYFDVIITKDDVVNKKPDPEQINKALGILNGNKDEAIIIGDSYHDVQAGKNAGISNVMYYPEENKKFYTDEDIKKENSDFIINDLLDLVKIVN